MTVVEDWGRIIETACAQLDGFNSPSASVGLGGRHGHYVLVGMGAVTNEKCGEYIGLKVCLDYGRHNLLMNGNVKLGGQVSLEGKNVKNKVAVHVVNHHCYNSACPKCYDAWAVREASKAEQRLEEGERRYSGKAEHFISSFAPNSAVNKLLDEEGGYKKYCAKVTNSLEVRGVVGALTVFHGFRFDNDSRHWYWSPHMHSLGFRVGGYDCRNCEKARFASKKVCKGCSGFEAVTRRENEKDGCIVKVAVDRKGQCEERESIFATVAYELRHATIRDDVKRAHACFWWGTVSYRKLKVVIEKQGCLCPICGADMSWGVFVGKGHIEIDPCNRDYKRNWIDDMFDDGDEPRFLERPSVSYGHFSNSK